ncbi:MAG: hypothetical protein JST86_03265 [Bacteroidetes bacterium]|nr:hypothetical protein [Bacteroidota bacterium]
MMKIFLSITLLFCCTFMCRAQQYDTTPPYLKTKLLPAFSLLDKDSVAFDQSVLVKGKRTIFMLFNPECEHCQHQLELLLTLPEITDSANLVMASTESFAKIKVFYDKYHLENFPSIHVGKDTKWALGVFFKPKTVPELIFYDAGGRWTFLNQGALKKKELLDALSLRAIL